MLVYVDIEVAIKIETTIRNNERTTAPTQKAGFRVPKTVLWLIKH
jgi:hypothetical protein